ncbi:hypothetical protein P353_15145 [Comamonas testosteroni]|uniref:Uncharacterized protein n=1 Tax=Comamonas testosteroni TaxID=285 RepID=A0A096FFN2_COMTE|nr:hypothetical protein P353_15145 [Comamonas testosteroni]
MLHALMARQPVSKELWRQLQPLIDALDGLDAATELVPLTNWS